MSEALHDSVFDRFDFLQLAAGANVQHRDNSLRTTLHEACLAGKLPIVDELLQAGVDPNAVDNNGRTALHLAATHSNKEGIMSSLLSAKANIDLVDHDGNTPLIWAACSGRAQSVQFLLQNGADLVKKEGVSARQVARRCYNKELVAQFECSLCGWLGMCCFNCRKKYCILECDKFTDRNNFRLENTVDCRLHQKLAHQSVLEWTLAMSLLNLPPYVLEIIFNSLKLNSKHEDYQQRKAIDFISIENNEKSSKITANFVHLIIEERTHQQNIRMFISVLKAHRNSQENQH